jgi:putative addiction module component (TIGR02574 family)
VIENEDRNGSHQAPRSAELVRAAIAEFAAKDLETRVSILQELGILDAQGDMAPPYASPKIVDEDLLRELLAIAIRLPEGKRIELADMLYMSLEPGGVPSEEDHEASWTAEIRRRIDDIEAGRVETFPAEQVLAEARQRLDERSAQRAKLEELQRWIVELAPAGLGFDEALAHVRALVSRARA